MDRRKFLASTGIAAFIASCGGTVRDQCCDYVEPDSCKVEITDGSEIKECLVFDRLLNPTEMEYLNHYMAKRYGIRNPCA